MMQMIMQGVNDPFDYLLFKCSTPTTAVQGPQGVKETSRAFESFPHNTSGHFCIIEVRILI
jgi:hypothetical protein